MAEVYLIMRRQDVPDGVLQVLDLWPNTSSKNYIYPPGLGQTKYINNIPRDAVTGGVTTADPVTATRDLTGLAAYLIDNVDTGAGAGGAPLTGPEADAAATSLATRVLNGLALEIADVNAVLAAQVAGSSLDGGGSTGSLVDLLAVMAGRPYLVPAGAEIGDGGGVFAGPAGEFPEDAAYKPIYDTGYFKVSLASGNLSLMTGPDFVYTDPNLPFPGVSVYAADGTIYSV